MLDDELEQVEHVIPRQQGRLREGNRVKKPSGTLVRFGVWVGSVWGSGENGPETGGQRSFAHVIHGPLRHCSDLWAPISKGTTMNKESIPTQCPAILDGAHTMAPHPQNQK